MKIHRFLAFFLLTLCCFTGLGWAEQPSFVEFSAKVLRHDSTHQELPSSGKIYVGRGGIRTETSKNQQSVWMIFKPDKKIVWTLFPKQKMYMERAGLFLEWPPLPEDENSPCRSTSFLCKKTGMKRIHGRSVIHWRIDLVGKKKNTFYAQLWVDPRLNIAIRETYADGLTVEMRQIREAPQAASLFELPEGYEKVTLPTKETRDSGEREALHP